MRVIFAALPTYGHAYPLLPLAVAAARAGHRVVFATAEAFLPTVRKAGLDVAPAGISLHEAFESAFVGDPRATQPRGEISQEELVPVIAAVFGDIAPRRLVADLAPLFERQRPDLVIYESGNPGAAMAAKLAGIPAVSHTFGRMSRGGLGGAIHRTILACATELGVAGAELASFGNPVIDICPESAQSAEFVAATRRTPLRPVGWCEPGDLPEGVRDRSRPLIYLTLGTAMGTIPVLSAAVAGLARLDADVLVATGPTIQASEIGTVPANVQVRQWVPQAELLAHLDLVVHHGGSGTVLGAFGAGLPQLLLPQGADQFTNADMVRELGVGEALVGEQVSVDTITEQARRLLTDSSVRAAAALLAVEIAAMPSPAEVAAQLPGLG